MSEEDFRAFQRRRKKEAVLTLLYKKRSSFPAELEKLTGIDIVEINELLIQLVKEKLVKKVIGKYYKLTYEGDKLASDLCDRSSEQSSYY